MLLALVQLKVTGNKVEDLKTALLLIKQAADNGAKLISLPECFNCPYGTQYFADYAEPIPGETSNTLSKIAKDLKVYIIGGSIPETRGEKIYNTTTVFGPDGTLIGTYSKIHLSDVNVPGKLVFTESSVLSPGNNLFTFQAGPLKVGLGICYDLRFPELAHLYDKQGCNLLIYPGAFNMITGPAHWLSLLTARALDNQLYVAGCGPARDENATYVTWGHSTVVDPWGKVIASTAEKEGIVYAEIDADYVDAIRNQIPIHFQKRNDIYQGNNLVES
ncbi:omega-amidase NIT2-like isoform X2 [Rhopilema esculentum]|uniref:omega-amidase NIT2-like isoform X1 n=1 Tax=Rhopilema esculentum TaxID=499914 RepID=UPI0031CF2F24